MKRDATLDQIAMIMLMHGTPTQVQEALEYVSVQAKPLPVKPRVTDEMVEAALNTKVIARGGGMTVEEYIIEGGRTQWSPNTYLFRGPNSGQHQVMREALETVMSMLDKK
jgi:hypothetical protein